MLQEALFPMNGAGGRTGGLINFKKDERMMTPWPIHGPAGSTGGRTDGFQEGRTDDDTWPIHGPAR